MKTLLVTSRVTFVPNNYDDFILPLLESPWVHGLMVVDNRDLGVLAQAAALVLTGSSPALGADILRNSFSISHRRRSETAQRLGKNFFVTKNPNSTESLGWIQQNQFDIILHSRSRTFFGRKLLASARLACLNVHHGLLPEQRGLMCDFWSLLENKTAGFSVHQMTPKLDDGPILAAVPVPYSTKNYQQYLRKSTDEEMRVCLGILKGICETGALPHMSPNVTDNAVYRRNPGLRELYRMTY